MRNSDSTDGRYRIWLTSFADNSHFSRVAPLNNGFFLVNLLHRCKRRLRSSRFLNLPFSWSNSFRNRCPGLIVSWLGLVWLGCRLFLTIVSGFSIEIFVLMLVYGASTGFLLGFYWFFFPNGCQRTKLSVTGVCVCYFFFLFFVFISVCFLWLRSQLGHRFIFYFVCSVVF